MAACPKCRNTELWVVRTRTTVEFVHRWGFFGRFVSRIRIVGVDVGCLSCFHAFTIHPDGITEAPLQTAHDQLKAAQAAANGIVPARKLSEDDPAPPPRNVARPARDPRVRTR